MFSRLTSSLALAAVSLALPLSLPAQPAREPARDPRTPAQRAAKGPLPDPALLDGSAQAPEKRPEFGMLGEFDIAGDENATSDRVGNLSEQASAQGGGAQGPQLNVNLPGMQGGARKDPRTGNGSTSEPA